MSAAMGQKTGGPGFRQSLPLKERRHLPLNTRLPKQATARMKIINGRPYYYEIVNLWDPVKGHCHQLSKYLGKALPKGYRLIK